jgi:hypothetical protein
VRADGKHSAFDPQFFSPEYNLGNVVKGCDLRLRRIVAVATVNSTFALSAVLGATPANAATCYWLYGSGMDGDYARLYYCYTQTSPGKYTAWGESIRVTDETPDGANAIIRATGDGFSPLVIARDAYGGDGSTGSFRKTNTANVRFNLCGELSGGIPVNCFRMTTTG